MIISPKNKFIFFKSQKTGSSSIEKLLCDFCGPNALVTAGAKLDSTRHKIAVENQDDTGVRRILKPSKLYHYQQQNNEYEEDGHIITRFHSHTTPADFLEKIKNKSTFDDFKKITVIRNPWDQLVSYYWFQFENIDNNHPMKITSHDSKDLIELKFEKWLHHSGEWPSYEKYCDTLSEMNTAEFFQLTNEKFIHDIITDYIIYEQGLLPEFCNVFKDSLALDTDNLTMPKLKSKHRKLKKHYSCYYNDKSQNTIQNLFSKTIEKFNYKFEKE